MYINDNHKVSVKNRWVRKLALDICIRLLFIFNKFFQHPCITVWIVKMSTVHRLCAPKHCIVLKIPNRLTILLDNPMFSLILSGFSNLYSFWKLHKGPRTWYDVYVNSSFRQYRGFTSLYFHFPISWKAIALRCSSAQIEVVFAI